VCPGAKDLAFSTALQPETPRAHGILYVRAGARGSCAMNRTIHSIVKQAAGVSAVLLLVNAGIPAAEAGTTMVKCSKASLQKAIDQANDGDTLEIEGVCMGNILIRDKALTLIGASSPGPHGITGTAADTDGVSIENSRGTHMEGLTITNPFHTGVRILYSSDVTMTDCEVNNSGSSIPDGATGIWVQDQSYFYGLRLRLDNNIRGLGALQNSRAWCDECDLNGNGSWAASAWRESFLTLRDSKVTGSRGLDARNGSYVDIDCASLASAHDCSLDTTNVAGLAYDRGTTAFYEAGDFNGSLWALDRSEIQMVGARQQSNPGINLIDSGSSIRLDTGSSGNSKLKGSTDVTGFSHALFYGGSTVLDGSLTCDQAGDAWVDSAIDLVSPGFTFNGCDHAP